jgi:hypothetical protein
MSSANLVDIPAKAEMTVTATATLSNVMKRSILVRRCWRISRAASASADGASAINDAPAS